MTYRCNGCHLKCSIETEHESKSYAPKSCPYNQVDMKGQEMSQWYFEVKE